MWLPRRPGNTCTHRLETIVIVGAEVILGIRSKMQRGFGGKRHAGKLARFRAIPPVELFPIENSIAFHVDEHIAIYLII